MTKPTTTIRILLNDHAYLKAYVAKHGGNIIGMVMQLVIMHRNRNQKKKG
jgi:hypothetical protein